MNSVADVISTLHKNDIDLKKLGLYRVYSNLYPPASNTPHGKVDVMVSEVNQLPETYGSDDFTHNIQSIQLNIFYGLSGDADQTVSMDVFEDSIASFLFTDGWKLLPSDSRYLDPRTQLPTKVLIFKRRKLRWKLQD